jgi:uncharacterized protein with NRDE domain
MCTVTYYKGTNGIFLTSNRDENISRPNASLMHHENLNGLTIMYPIDPLAFGSWFGYRTDKSALVLLNGAFVKHRRIIPYNRSRGLVLLEILKQQNFNQAWANVSLEGVEPFSLVAYQHEQLSFKIWDGEIKYSEELNSEESHIWSSVTLYDEAIRMSRKTWFVDFLKSNAKEKTAEDLIQFHTQTGKDNSIDGLVINRDNIMLTKNITQISLLEGKAKMLHWELLKQEKQITEHAYNVEQVS